ncbi:hypothetical protein [Floridanema evergladense]|uniref:Bacteriocin immunity protein n=1 Tax=Floridaenema evergladense BLCC-F167 TaxID=3153639 RepID=A0ABV4WNB5_9CYAN
MELKDLVRSLKYESNVDSLIAQAASQMLSTNNPLIYKEELLITLLAVSDQKEGRLPSSTNSLYQEIYRISESI